MPFCLQCCRQLSMFIYIRFLILIIINKILRVFLGLNYLEKKTLILLKENQILKKKLKKIQFKNKERVFYTTFIHSFKTIKDFVAVSPETVLKWHKKLIKKKWDYSDKRSPGRSETSKYIHNLIIRMKSDNPRWGCRRIKGELKKLKIRISKTTVYNILRKSFPDNTPRGQSWYSFIKSHGKRLWVADYFTIETAFLKRLYVFFIIDMKSKEIVYSHVTKQPNATWLKNSLRNFLSFKKYLPQVLLTDNDPTYRIWLAPFLSQYEIKHIRTPPATPLCNVYAERMVRTFREELTDRMIFFGEKDLKHALNDYILYYNKERAHSSLNFNAPTKRFRVDSNICEQKIKSTSWLDALMTTYALEV